MDVPRALCFSCLTSMSRRGPYKVLSTGKSWQGRSYFSEWSWFVPSCSWQFLFFLCTQTECALLFPPSCPHKIKKFHVAGQCTHKCWNAKPHLGFESGLIIKTPNIIQSCLTSKHCCTLHCGWIPCLPLSIFRLQSTIYRLGIPPDIGTSVESLHNTAGSGDFKKKTARSEQRNVKIVFLANSFVLSVLWSLQNSSVVDWNWQYGFVEDCLTNIFNKCLRMWNTSSCCVFRRSSDAQKWKSVAGI